MNQINEAMARLGTAISRLEQALAEGGPADDTEIQAERDRLQDEVRTLRSRAADDAKLRAEAASAVREALRDLRGAVAQENGEERANA